MIEKSRVGPFEILDRLGTNRRHKVFHARQVEQNREIALKFIHLPPDMDRQAAFARIQREVEILKQLHHPHLVPIYGAGVADDEVFFAYELIHGESLTALLARRGKLATDLAIEWAVQVADALAYLHEQDIVHSKLTPDKILIDDLGRVRLIDVRLNRAKRRSWDATHRRELDTAAYMAPEQFNEGATAKSDLYALGAILYEMLTGRIPLEPASLASVYNQKTTQRPPSVASVVLDCPIWLDRLIVALLDPDPLNRPHSARAVYYALLEIRKIDRNKTAVVNQMTLGFNPLTIGADKTEAKRLLGQLDVKPPKPPFHQRTWVQAAALILVIGLIAYLTWPASNRRLFERAERLMASQSSSDVARACEYFEQIVARNWGDRWSADAPQRLDAARIQLLILYAREDMKPIGQNAQDFIDAYNLERAGNTAEASKRYRDLCERLQYDDKFRYLAEECERRVRAIAEGPSLRSASQADATPAKSATQ